LTLACAGFLELTVSRLRLLKSKFNAESFIGKLSLAISAQFALKMCVAARNHEKFTKTLNLGGSRSIKVIDVDKSKNPTAMLVIISNMYLSICNFFTLYEQNSSKIQFLEGTPI